MSQHTSPRRSHPKHRSTGFSRPLALPTSFAGVIGLWPSAAELAEVLDVEAVTVRAWRRRGIPARYWSAVALAARLSNRPVDERLLAELGSLRSHRHG